MCINIYIVTGKGRSRVFLRMSSVLCRMTEISKFGGFIYPASCLATSFYAICTSAFT